MDDINRLVKMELGVLSRRLRGMAMISRGIVPNLVVSQKVVDHVVNSARGYLQDETGESMIGLVVDTDEAESLPTLYVLDTISPDESVIRRSTMFEQGDIFQTDLYNWLLDNWNTSLRLGRDGDGNEIPEHLREPIKHLGDWHKQPGFMIQPSGGDLGTALRIMDDPENDFEFLLVPIVTLGHPSVTSEDGAKVNYFSVAMGDGTNLRMDWWYIHRDVRVFQPISPTIMPADELPSLAPPPWHILDVELMDEEHNLIQDDGMFMLVDTVFLHPLDDKLPLEIGFIVGRGSYNDVFIVMTHWDYPNTRPRIFKAPFAGVNQQMYIYEIFNQLWEQAEEVEPPPNFEWNPDTSYVIDLLAATEKHLGMRPDDLPMPWERANLSAERVGAGGAISIDVDIEDEHSPAADEVDGQVDGTVDEAMSDDKTEIIARQDLASIHTLHDASEASSDGASSDGENADADGNNDDSEPVAADDTTDDEDEKQAIRETEED